MSSTRSSSTTTDSRGGGNTRQRRAPRRTCVGCRRTGDQASFVRLVSSDGAVTIDEGRRRQPGRGAYLCRETPCWERALAGPLGRALRTTITDADREALLAYGTQFGAPDATDNAADNMEHTDAALAGRDDDTARQTGTQTGTEKERHV